MDTKYEYDMIETKANKSILAIIIYYIYLLIIHSDKAFKVLDTRL